MHKFTIITSAVISASFFILGLVLITERENAVIVRSDDVIHQNEPASEQSVNGNNDQLQLLEDKIDTLQEKQQALVNRNFLLEKRIGQLEDNLPQISAQWNIDANNTSNDSEMLVKDIEQEEQTLAEENQNMEFDNLASQLIYEDYDANWQAEMEASFNTIEQRLQEFNFTSTTITQSECGTQTCLVEYTHDKAIDSTLIAGLLAAQGASEVILKHKDEGSGNRTLALYKR